jgi:transposase-like protein
MNADFIDQFHFNDSTRVTCPLCSPERRKQNQKDMTLTRKPDGAVVYHCHHCYSNGSIQPHKERKLSAVPAVKITSNKLQSQHYDYLKTRGISPQTADRMRLFAADKYFSRLSKTGMGHWYQPSTDPSQRRTSHKTLVGHMISLGWTRSRRVSQSSSWRVRSIA